LNLFGLFITDSEKNEIFLKKNEIFVALDSDISIIRPR